MPRTARLDAPGVLHHIIIRGIEGRNIFLENKDREDFLERLEKLLPETKTACYAWAFIPNHAHFLLRTGVVPLSTLMRRLLTGYAVSFNHRRDRHGQLFQNRYKSIVCQEDAYFKELVRYIHLNPIRSGIVSTMEELNRYPYTGHSALMSKQSRVWQDVNYVLGYFSSSARHSQKNYFSFVAKGLKEGRRNDLTGGGLIRSLGGWSEVKKLREKDMHHIMSDERILGDSEFVESVLSYANERYESSYELKRRGYDLDRIAERVAEIYGIEVHHVYSKGKQTQKVKARSLLCYWAVREVGVSLREMARRLEMTAPAIGYAVERGESLAKDNGYRLLE